LPLSARRVLIVDDVADNRAVLARPLVRRGFEVVEAAGGFSALELVVRRRFDVVLLDIMMPGVDGIQVLRRIRADYSPEQLPILMVSAATDRPLVEQAFALGANDYITKPIDFAVAFLRIEQALSSRSVSTAA
jgi:CheY-like chemotaxis protein